MMGTVTDGVRVQLEGVTKTYRKGGEAVDVLRGVDLTLEPGSFAALVGPSGSGKSTFLHLLGLLDRPTAGRITLDDHDAETMTNAQRDRTRNRRVGFVFQAHHLLPEHDALGNVMVPVRLAGATLTTARRRAAAILDAVGLSHRLTHLPSELSGGEQQRVAIARALVMAPGLVLADEPTGNLDPTTAGGVFDLLLELNRELGSTLVAVTHDHALARRFDRRLELVEGRIVEAA